MMRMHPAVERFSSIDEADLDPFIQRIGDARVVLLGEMTHGTSEFYRMRARITQELVKHHGFDVVALEADWPDAARVDHYVRHRDVAPREWQPFARWPPWMWRNAEFAALVDDLRGHNLGLDARQRATVCGLDMYSMSTSITEVLSYLEEHDPEAAKAARRRYGCLSGWQEDPAHYGAAALRGLADCEEPVVEMLREMLARRVEEAELDGDALFEAQRNAQVVQAAEEYYRAMYRGEVSSWNLRDSHMADTLESVLHHRGPDSRAIIWAHNSHVGDAAASEMGRRGETTLGALCRAKTDAYLVGQFTDHGTVVAGADWDAPAQVKVVQTARRDSHEAWLGGFGKMFFMPLRNPPGTSAQDGDRAVGGRLERAIGVVYRPDTERQSHYFRSDLAGRFDEVVWFEETSALQRLDVPTVHDVPETYPFGV